MQKGLEHPEAAHILYHIETNNGGTDRHTLKGHDMKPTLKRDATEAALIATVLTVIMTALEIPLLWVYLAFKWVTAFVGAMVGFILWRLAQALWKAYKARRAAK